MPNMDPGNAYQIIATMAYTRVQSIPLSRRSPQAAIYLNSHARDFNKFRKSGLISINICADERLQAEERVKLLKLLWDCLASQFGGSTSFTNRRTAARPGNPALLSVRRTGLRQRR